MWDSAGAFFLFDSFHASFPLKLDWMDRKYHFFSCEFQKRKMLVWLQLVCFYYVLTTFTTVGYGKCWSEKYFSMLHQNHCVWFWIDCRWYLCNICWRAGLCVQIRILQYKEPIQLNKITKKFASGILHLPLSFCSVSVWNNYCTSQRNSLWHNNQEEGTGQNFGVLPQS